MIELYTWSTPNGRKISIMLEELGLAYEVKTVDIGRGEQHAPAFLKLSPNNKIPAIVDDDTDGGPLAVFESGAILTYLADRTGQLLPPYGAARYQTLEWLHWSIAGLGPMMGQLMFFALQAEQKLPVAIDRFTHEAGRLLGVMNRRLDESPFLGGDSYSIADIAAYTWSVAATSRLGDVLASTLANTPAVHRWLATVGTRPAVQRGMNIPASS